MRIERLVVKQRAADGIKHYIVQGDVGKAELFGVFLHLLAVCQYLGGIEGCIEGQLSHALKRTHHALGNNLADIGKLDIGICSLRCRSFCGSCSGGGSRTRCKIGKAYAAADAGAGKLLVAGHIACGGSACYHNALFAQKLNIAFHYAAFCSGGNCKAVVNAGSFGIVAGARGNFYISLSSLCRGGSSLNRSGSRCGSRCGSFRCGSAGLGRSLLSACGKGAYILAGSAYNAYIFKAGHIVALLVKDGKQHAGILCLLVKGGLVRLVGEKNVAYCYGIAYLFVPFCDDAAFHRLSLPGHNYGNRHILNLLCLWGLIYKNCSFLTRACVNRTPAPLILSLSG